MFDNLVYLVIPATVFAISYALGSERFRKMLERIASKKHEQR